MILHVMQNCAMSGLSLLHLCKSVPRRIVGGGGKLDIVKSRKSGSKYPNRERGDDER